MHTGFKKSLLKQQLHSSSSPHVNAAAHLGLSSQAEILCRCCTGYIGELVCEATVMARVAP